MLFRFGLVWRRLLGFALLWWVLTEGYPGAWGLGVPIILASLLATFLLPSVGDWSWRLAGLARFLPFFLLQSLRGGIDVARRALHPQLPLAPQMFEFRFRLPASPARIFFADTVSLLPGTCSASLQEESLQIHVLDASLPVAIALRQIEERVAELFGLSLPAECGGGELHE
jgi:multicomponent Na+:H+ antiporter subunit E